MTSSAPRPCRADLGLWHVAHKLKSLGKAYVSQLSLQEI